MDIRCPSCSKLFRVADEKISGKGIRFKCSKCAEVITITKDDFEMDLLAREDAVTETVPQQPSGPVTRPSPPTAPEPTIKPVPPQPIPSPAPEAREYQPPQEQDIPPAVLSDFDFSEPHAAAMAAAHPEEGFGGQDFSFNVEPEQEAAPEFEISPEAAAEAEAAMQFPDDLISEPARTPMFGMPSAGEPVAAELPMHEPGSKPEPEMKTQPSVSQGETPRTEPVFTPPPRSKPAPEKQADMEIDLGAALAIPKGPVLTPDLQSQMKRGAPDMPTAQAKAVSHADADIDLGTVLAIPKSAEIVDQKATEAGPGTAVVSRGSGSPVSSSRVLVIGTIAFALVAALVALYSFGFLPGKIKQLVLQLTQPKAQTARQEITPEGLSIVDPAAFFDPELGDIVITGKIQNSTDKPKAGWYLVTEIRDAKETVLATISMVNGIQIYSKADYDILVKRGGNIAELQKKISTLSEATISPKGGVSFEVRVMNPPAGSSGFLPTLRSFDLATVRAAAQEGMGRK